MLMCVGHHLTGQAALHARQRDNPSETIFMSHAHVAMDKSLRCPPWTGHELPDAAQRMYTRAWIRLGLSPQGNGRERSWCRA
jgi:hypothetical protein